MSCQVTKVTEERDRIQSSLAEREKEARELTKQVSSLKDNLAAEQRKSRSKTDSLQEVGMAKLFTIQKLDMCHVSRTFKVLHRYTVHKSFIEIIKQQKKLH